MGDYLNFVGSRSLRWSPSSATWEFFPPFSGRKDWIYVAIAVLRSWFSAWQPAERFREATDGAGFWAEYASVGRRALAAPEGVRQVECLAWPMDRQVEDFWAPRGRRRRWGKPLFAPPAPALLGKVESFQKENRRGWP